MQLIPLCFVGRFKYLNLFRDHAPFPVDTASCAAVQLKKDSYDRDTGVSLNNTSLIF